jgi:hypothetical protein
MKLVLTMSCLLLLTGCNPGNWKPAMVDEKLGFLCRSMGEGRVDYQCISAQLPPKN